MAEQNTHAQKPAQPNDASKLEGATVEALATLGAKSRGIAITEIETEGFDGLPSSFPIAIVRGDQPMLKGVKDLAEQWRIHPERRKGTATVGDVESFCALVDRHKTEDTVVFVKSDWRAPSLTAVIDYHARQADGRPGFGQHRIHYSFPSSEEWKVWVAKNGEAMEQSDFAEFIEERIPDLTAPDDATRNWVERDLKTTVAAPAKLMELSRGLQVAVGSKIKNFQTLQSGEATLTFEEEHTGADGQPLRVPGAFVIYVPVFYGAEPIEIPVRLRYRVRGGTIAWTYLLFRPDRIIGEAVDDAKKTIAQKTGLPIYEGAPEMPA